MMPHFIAFGMMILCSIYKSKIVLHGAQAGFSRLFLSAKNGHNKHHHRDHFKPAHPHHADKDPF